MDYCLAADSSSTISGMIPCEEIALKEWDQELNNYYRLLMENLDQTGKEKLKASRCHVDSGRWA